MSEEKNCSTPNCKGSALYRSNLDEKLFCKDCTGMELMRVMTLPPHQRPTGGALLFTRVSD